MKLVPIAKRISQKQTSDELTKPGDFYIVKSLETVNARSESRYEAVILKCPFCGMDMATTQVHKIRHPKKGWFERISHWLGFPQGISIDAMIQCPYVNTHKFKIKNGVIIVL